MVRHLGWGLYALLLRLLQCGRILNRELSRRRVLALGKLLVRCVREIRCWEDASDEN